MQRELERRGAKVHCCPTVDIVSLPLSASMAKLLEQLERFDGILFSSKNGVRCFLRLFRQHARRHDLGQLRRLAAAAVGASTARLWQRCTKVAPLYPLQEKGSRALVECMARQWITEAAVAANKGDGQTALLVNGPKRWLFPSATRGGEPLSRALQQLGFIVAPLACYETKSRSVDAIDLSPFTAADVDIIVFFSPSQVRALTAALKHRGLFPLPSKTLVLSMGERTTTQIRQDGYGKTCEASISSVDGLLTTLASVGV